METASQTVGTRPAALRIWAVAAWCGICGPAICLGLAPLSGRFEVLKDIAWLATPLVVGGAIVAVLLIPVVSNSGRGVSWLVSTSSAMLAVMGAGLFLGYVHWLSYRLPDGAAVAPGQVAPEIIATNPDGQTFRLSDHRGQRVALVFYRGMW